MTDAHRTVGARDRSRPRIRILAATAAATALLMTGCGHDVPGDPMDDDQLESLFLSGRDIPEEWNLHSGPRMRQGEVRHTASAASSVYLGFMSHWLFGFEDSPVCEDLYEDFRLSLDGVETTAQGYASYMTAGEGSLSAFVYMGATTEEVDLATETIDTGQACFEDMTADGGYAGETEFSEFSGETHGFTADSEGPQNGGLRVYTGESYGQNHLMLWGYAREAGDEDEERLAGFFTEIRERFEEGPDEAD